MTRRSNFDSGHNRNEYRFDHEDGPNQIGEHRINAYHPSYSEHHPVSWITYDQYDNDTTPTIDITYFKSNDEGKGHGKAIMQHLYDFYPKHFINWGHVVHPAAEHLASQFEEHNFHRTAYYVEGGYN
jgi:GNAT superfamily N-acetyltransferase